MGGYRQTDPGTVERAFRELQKTGGLSKNRADIITVLRRFDRATAGEIARALLLQSRNNVATRLSELRDLGIVRGDGRDACKVTGRNCIVWKLTNLTAPRKIEKRESKTARLERENEALKIENEQLRNKLLIATAKPQRELF